MQDFHKDQHKVPHGGWESSLKKTRLSFEVHVPEADLAAFYERARAAGIPDPSVRLNRAVTQAVLAAVTPPVGMPALHDANTQRLERIGQAEAYIGNADLDDGA